MRLQRTQDIKVFLINDLSDAAQVQSPLPVKQDLLQQIYFPLSIKAVSGFIYTGRL